MGAGELRVPTRTHQPGVVYTDADVAATMLDIVGWTPESRLWEAELLEPGCGAGAFVIPAVRRLLESMRRHGIDTSAPLLVDRITAVDIEPDAVEICRRSVVAELQEAGLDSTTSKSVASAWIRCDDALLSPHIRDRRYTHVVGNPPYIRVEAVDPERAGLYRAAYTTLRRRACLSTAFLELGLEVVADAGRVVYIVPEAWATAASGAALRAMITADYDVVAWISAATDAFVSPVSVRAAVVAIRRGVQSADVPVVKAGLSTPGACAAAVAALAGDSVASASGFGGATTETHSQWFTGSVPWILGGRGIRTIVAELEARFTALGDVATVSIGIATGADSVFITDPSSGVEPELLIPLVMRRHIDDIETPPTWVIDTSKVKCLDDWPGLAAYLRRHETGIRARYVARRNPAKWWRTVDPVRPRLVGTPKLVIPDIAGAVCASRADWGYPHHNLYSVTSDTWDLDVLGALLSSVYATVVVAAYSTRIRGGYIRCQAQHLRRIRIPDPSSIPRDVAEFLASAFRARDFASIDAIAESVYGIEIPIDFEFTDTRK